MQQVLLITDQLAAQSLVRLTWLHHHLMATVYLQQASRTHTPYSACYQLYNACNGPRTPLELLLAMTMQSRYIL
jgi:hypothetical protein